MDQDGWGALGAERWREDAAWAGDGWGALGAERSREDTVVDQDRWGALAWTGDGWGALGAERSRKKHGRGPGRVGLAAHGRGPEGRGRRRGRNWELSVRGRTRPWTGDGWGALGRAFAGGHGRGRGTAGELEDAAVDGGGGELRVPSGRRKKSESPALEHCSPSCLENGLVFGFPA